MAEYVNGSTDILGGSVIRYALNTTTPNQAVIRKIIAGNGISITSTGVDPGTGDVTISIDTSGTGGSGGGSGGSGSGSGGTPTAVGTVTSVNMIVPTGLTVYGAPITTAGTLNLQLSSGYVIPLYTDVEKGVDAYNNTITNLSYSTTTGIVTLTQRDGGGMIAPITLDPFTTSNLTEGSNLYYTDVRARAAVSETITGIDYNSTTGVFSLTSGYLIPTTTSATNWDTAYSWGNHASAGYQLLSEKGVANGYASLDGGGRVPSAQLPSYVDDVLEYANLASFPATGETGKIYVTLDTNKIYRWSGSVYIEISQGNLGTVTQVSVVSANGFAGSVANDSTTPAITLSTTITGLIKGNGTALSAAVAGTDYQAPISLTTTGNAGPATFIGNTLNVPVYTFVTDGLVSGGIVTWSGVGFIYDVSAAYYYLNSVYYTTTNTQVTLGAADISNPRLDIVAVNNQGQVIVIPGVPSSNPVKAQIDPTTQIELATILVPAGATSPVNILTAIIYDESGNSTWSSSATGVTVDFANATTPYTGSVTASVTASTTGTRYIQFDRISGTDSVSNYSVFKFAIRLGTAWTSTSTLAIGFYNNNTLISTEVSVLSGQFGFNINTTATYQLIQIPIANWRFTQASFNRIRLRFLNSLPAFRLDRVELQAGVVQTLVQSNNIYTTDGSLAGIRTLTLNGNYLDIVGSTATTRFLANGTISIGGTITATTLASGSDKLVLASATGVLSAVTIGTGLSYSGGTLTATGTLTSANFVTDYDSTVTGLRNSSNKVYTTSQNFVSGTTHVYVNGVRMSRGATYDYTETAVNQITFTNAPDSGDLIVIDYIKS